MITIIIATIMVIMMMITVKIKLSRTTIISVTIRIISNKQFKRMLKAGHIVQSHVNVKIKGILPHYLPQVPLYDSINETQRPYGVPFRSD